MSPWTYALIAFVVLVIIFTIYWFRKSIKRTVSIPNDERTATAICAAPGVRCVSRTVDGTKIKLVLEGKRRAVRAALEPYKASVAYL
jgi:hypothetical protein